ncbi:glycosyltransferase [Marinobacter psychrophilus]|uniref:glycosyltransferase n=1 Tax=Marinobacter psychrophilus TaxID=330734 RepID=UPI000AA01E97
MANSELAICIFSYNQGNRLGKCIDSFVNMAPNCNLYIFDDDSSDEETIKVLQKNKHVVKDIFFPVLFR